MEKTGENHGHGDDDRMHKLLGLASGIIVSRKKNWTLLFEFAYLWWRWTTERCWNKAIFGGEVLLEKFIDELVQFCTHQLLRQWSRFLGFANYTNLGIILSSLSDHIASIKEIWVNILIAQSIFQTWLKTYILFVRLQKHLCSTTYWNSFTGIPNSWKYATTNKI